MAHRPSLRTDWGDRLVAALTAAERHHVVDCLGMDARGLELPPELSLARGEVLPVQLRVGGPAPRFYSFKMRVATPPGRSGGVCRLEFVDADHCSLRDVARAASDRSLYRGSMPTPPPPPVRAPAPESAADATPPPEQSVIERARAEGPISVLLIRLGDAAAARAVADEALAGTLFVQTPRWWPSYSRIGVRLQWPDGEYLELRGHVAYHVGGWDEGDEPAGVGIDLETLAPPVRDELEARGA